MSKQEDNRHNRNLKKLLDNTRGSTNSPMDDFEKEALEGFAMLSGNEEALDLKKALDKKMYTDVFGEEKKPSSLRYWYAAAGLVIAIGFTVYFVKNTLTNKEPDLALQSPRTSETIDPPLQKQPELSDKNEVQKTTTRQGASDERTENTLPSNSKSESIQNKGSEFKSITKTVETENLSNAAVGTSSMEDLAAPPVSASKQDLERDKKNASAVLDVEQNKNREGMNLEEISVVSKDEIKKTKASRKKEKALESKERAESLPSSPAVIASDDVAAKPEFVCAYKSGETGLIKDLRVLLKNKNLLQKFNAIVYVGVSGKVEKAELTRTYKLSASEQKEVILILKSLDQFDMSQNAGSYLYPYKIEFRP